MRYQQGFDRQPIPDSRQPPRFVSPVVAVTFVVPVPKPRLGRHRDQQKRARLQRCDKRREQGEIVRNMLQHVHARDQPGVVDARAEIFRCIALDELDARKPPLGQANPVGRGVDPHAAIALRQIGDIGARAAADVDDRRFGRRRDQFVDEAPQDSSAADKPPMPFFNVGMKLELRRLHGISATIGFANRVRRQLGRDLLKPSFHKASVGLRQLGFSVRSVIQSASPLQPAISLSSAEDARLWLVLAIAGRSELRTARLPRKPCSRDASTAIQA